MALPPGVTAKTFAEATRLFEETVGKQWVFTQQADVDLYRDAYSVLRGEPDERVASAAVAPASVEEVQKVVRIANEHRIPIYPISTGRNLGYGGSTRQVALRSLTSSTLFMRLRSSTTLPDSTGAEPP